MLDTHHRELPVHQTSTTAVLQTCDTAPTNRHTHKNLFERQEESLSITNHEHTAISSTTTSHSLSLRLNQEPNAKSQKPKPKPKRATRYPLDATRVPSWRAAASYVARTDCVTTRRRTSGQRGQGERENTTSRGEILYVTSGSRSEGYRSG